ncbi:FecR family protein [Pseudoflavitalea rhizosphaerae]|uniref:FecR family protein n=1 Tax=Pseudoflavitalea rhizosphaerae TaxID=1884793 RepID=UPI000F8CB408|nr:FecR family protein [Pseudoflavitalea rhizosphaerae]
MPETVKKIASLILKYWRQELEEDDLNELLDWANHTPANKEAFARLINPDFIVGRLRELTLVKQEMKQRVRTALQLSEPEVQEEEEITEKDKRQFRIFDFHWWKWVAAVILLLIAVLLFLWFNQSSSRSKVSTAEANIAVEAETAELPARSQVRFEDGRLLYPDTMRYGTVLEYGRLKLTREPGGVRFITIAANDIADSALFATITTPPGEKLTVWLPDGTEVKLNGASLLRFPERFSARGRAVEASGELYFDVLQQGAGGTSNPFFVHTSGMNMEARAARFNVHVYSQEKLAAATLEAGSLRVWKQVLHTGPGLNRKDRLDVVLEPGQQAQVSNSTDGSDMGGIRVDKADLKEVLSWKNEQ